MNIEELLAQPKDSLNPSDYLWSDEELERYQKSGKIPDGIKIIRIFVGWYLVKGELIPSPKSSSSPEAK